jgi:hypothetical protein
MISLPTLEKHRPHGKLSFPTRPRVVSRNRLPRQPIPEFRESDEGPDMVLQELIGRISRGERIRGRCL